MHRYESQQKHKEEMIVIIATPHWHANVGTIHFGKKGNKLWAYSWSVKNVPFIKMANAFQMLGSLGDIMDL